MANEITRRYGSQGVVGLSLHPGGIMTELGRHIDPKEIEELGGEAMIKTFKSPQQGAATTVWAAVSPHFEKVENTGRYLADVGEGPPQKADSEMGGPIYAPHAYDEEGAKALWKISCEVTGVAAE